jgi:hypothetical protein
MKSSQPMSIECRVWSSTTYFDTRVGEQRTRANTSAVFAHLSDKLATASPSSSFHRSTSLFLGRYWTSISTAKLTAPVVLFVGIAGCDGKYKAIQLCIFASEIATSFWQLCEPYLFALCRCQNAFRRIFTHNLILVRQQWHAISDQLLDLFIGVPGMPQHYWDSILFSWTGFRRWFYENYKWSLLFFLAKEFVCAIIIPIFFKFLIMQRDQ